MSGGQVRRLRVPAKVNLFFEVLRRRDDGFHEIDTVMQTIDLFDELVIETADDRVVVIGCEEAGIPPDQNLVSVAANRLKEFADARCGCIIKVRKRIPAARGLGGGSADAAATLAALSDLWGCGLGIPELGELAADIGSDVPFFLFGGTARCRGRGERIEPIRTPFRAFLVLVVPDIRLATRRVYEHLTAPCEGGIHRIDDMLSAVARGDVTAGARAMFNRLDETACRLVPCLAAIKERLREHGALAASVSGSGSAVFGVARDRDDARRIGDRIAHEALGEVHVVRTNVRTDWQQHLQGDDH